MGDRSGGGGRSSRGRGGGGGSISTGEVKPGSTYNPGPVESHPNWEKAIKDSTYSETVKGQYGKYERAVTPKVWRKGDKERIYVPRNAYEQAGYVTKDIKDVSGRNSGAHKGWGYNANRPGNVGELTRFIDNLVKYDVH